MVVMQVSLLTNSVANLSGRSMELVVSGLLAREPNWRSVSGGG